jgi:uncharacterized protein (DUF433 family)
MTTAGTDPRLLPAYTLGEAAVCVRVPPATLRSWCSGRAYSTAGERRHSAPLLHLADRQRGLFSFVNLIESQVLRALRKSHALSLQNVRKALAEYGRHDPKDHPLAFEDFLTDGLDLFVDRYGDLVNLSRSGQIALRSALELHLRRVGRDKLGPIRLYPFVHGDGDLRQTVSVSPGIAFGRPVIEGTRIGTDDVVARIRRGDAPEAVAEDLRLTPDQVVDACVFEEWGRRGAAKAA